MKKITFLLLMFLFLLPSTYLYGQEEFFGNKNGLSLSYLKAINAPVQADAFGLSFYSKKGFITGFGVERAGDVAAPMATLLLCPDWADNPSGFKTYIGPSYSYVIDHHVVGVNVGMIKCFFGESNFPFSINGAFSLQAIMGDKSSMGSRNASTLGYGYTQAFYAHSKIYPAINISGSLDTKSGDKVYFISFGINVKLDTDSAEK